MARNRRSNQRNRCSKSHPHTSEAVAPPWLSSHAFQASMLPMPSHSTVWSEAGHLGSMVSSMVKVAVVLLALSQSSVAVKITVTEPVAPQSSLNQRNRGSTRCCCSCRSQKRLRCCPTMRQCGHVAHAIALDSMVSSLRVDDRAWSSTNVMVAPHAGVATVVCRSVCAEVSAHWLMQPPLTGASIHGRSPCTIFGVRTVSLGTVLFAILRDACLRDGWSHGVLNGEHCGRGNEVARAIRHREVTVAEPVAPQSSLKPAKSLLQVSDKPAASSQLLWRWHHRGWPPMH